MGGEDHFRIRLLWRCSVDIEAVALDGEFFESGSRSGELTIEIVSDGSFIAGDGFDVDELASERDCVHGRRINYSLRSGGELRRSCNLNMT